MQYDEFVGHVQHRAHLASSGEAVSAIRATLETLAERLAGGAAENLAAQLPQEIAIYLQTVPLGERDRQSGTRLSLDDFYGLVSIREGIDLPKSVHHARAVIEVLSEAVSPGRSGRSGRSSPMNSTRFSKPAVLGIYQGESSEPPSDSFRYRSLERNRVRRVRHTVHRDRCFC